MGPRLRITWKVKLREEKMPGSAHFSLACFTSSVPQAACAEEPGYEAIVTGQFKLNIAVDLEWFGYVDSLVFQQSADTNRRRNAKNENSKTVSRIKQQNLTFGVL